MGLPERLVDRQLSKGDGELQQRLRLLRWSKTVLLVAAVLGLLTSALQLATGVAGGARVLWATLGAVWVVAGWTALRQRRYLTRRQ